MIGNYQNSDIQKIIIIKVDADGNSTLTDINNELSNLAKNVICYPNPANNIITFRKGEQFKNSNLKIYDINGKQILTQKLENSETQINIETLESGIYIYKCFDNETIIETGKFVKQ